ncbi:MAG: hypothetical protein WC907_07690 [Acholeplasmataceae bacterium]
MQEFPDILNFGEKLSESIDSFFKWFRNTFSSFFDFIKNLLDGSLNLIDNIFNHTPWWIIVIMVIIYLIFKFIFKNKDKLKWLIISSIFIL